jgi:3-hydroxyacyl-[acyl-carrier-protein] dehydratase
MDIDKIRERLPHRFPFLLLDKVTEISKEHIRAVKNVTVNEPFFQGHFPEKPVMPGVLIIESMAQAVGLMHQETYPSGLGFLVGIDGARIRRQVTPGDQLILEAEVVRQRPRLCKAQAKAIVDGEVVAEAVISLISDEDA